MPEFSDVFFYVRLVCDRSVEKWYRTSQAKRAFARALSSTDVDLLLPTVRIQEYW
jgi:hypothetical protein